MKKMSANEIRNSWINFFEQKKHYFLEPVSLVPINDNSLLWINSGVATLKDYFSGKKNPPSTRLVNAQKALRTNDFFNVGVTSRHNTLFEMLGNFSIGDYFKKDAIQFAFELLTKEWNITLDKLWITVFEDDKETRQIWMDLGIAQNHILMCNRDRNFWDVGNGPCGPCTEIYYDRGNKYDPNNLGTKLILDDVENDRYVEIWNIVFSCLNNDGANNYTELLRKNIDTGAGLERLASISQDVPTNFDTDLFQTIIKQTEQFSKYKYDIENYFVNNSDQNKINFAYKVIADHFRAAVFAIADGAIPDNKDRGYVLRRLIRRATVFAHKLGITNKEWVNNTIDGVINSFQPFYSYLLNETKKIKTIINKEINFFELTLSQGMKLFKEALENNKLTNDLVFQLVTTYGFPIEIIKELAQENSIVIDENEFQKRFAEHQKVSNATNANKAMDNQNNALMTLDLPSKFIYGQYESTAKIIKLYDNDFNEVTHLIGNGYVILDETIFYATSGGQQHDIGYINDNIFVDNVIKAPNLQHVHHVINANLKLGNNVKLVINKIDRLKNAAHHSTEHLLQSALKKFISNNIKQQGAFKAPNKLTFDFQHYEKVDDAVLAEIENWINQVVAEKIPVEVLMMTLEEAQKNNAAAYFEDVYKKINSLLRVIKMGDKSIELCGGTHVNNTEEIEVFAITDYFAKGSGMWRIEGISTWDNINNYKNDFFLKLKRTYQNMRNDFIVNEVSIIQLDEFYQQMLQFAERAPIRQYAQLWKCFEQGLSKLKVEFNNIITKRCIIAVKDKFAAIKGSKKLLIVDDNKYDLDGVNKALVELANESDNTMFAALIIQNNKMQYIFICSKNINFNFNEIINNVNAVSDGKGSGKLGFGRGGSNNLSKQNAIIDALKTLGFEFINA